MSTRDSTEFALAWNSPAPSSPLPGRHLPPLSAPAASPTPPPSRRGCVCRVAADTTPKCADSAHGGRHRTLATWEHVRGGTCSLHRRRLLHPRQAAFRRTAAPPAGAHNCSAPTFRCCNAQKPHRHRRRGRLSTIYLKQLCWTPDKKTRFWGDGPNPAVVRKPGKGSPRSRRRPGRYGPAAEAAQRAAPRPSQLIWRVSDRPSQRATVRLSSARLAQCAQVPAPAPRAGDASAPHFALALAAQKEKERAGARSASAAPITRR